MTFVARTAYPGAMELRNDMPRWAAYVRDAIVEPAIGRDILALALRSLATAIRSRSIRIKSANALSDAVGFASDRLEQLVPGPSPTCSLRLPRGEPGLRLGSAVGRDA